jgi:hypothetical protein
MIFLLLFSGHLQERVRSQKIRIFLVVFDQVVVVFSLASDRNEILEFVSIEVALVTLLLEVGVYDLTAD